MKRRYGGDLLEIGVEGDEFGGVVDGDDSDEEIERASGDTGLSASLSKVGGTGPKVRWGGEHGESLELLVELRGFGGGGMAEDFEGDRLGEVGVGMEYIRSNEPLEVFGGTRTGEVDPKARVDECGHQAFLARPARQRWAMEASLR